MSDAKEGKEAKKPAEKKARSIDDDIARAEERLKRLRAEKAEAEKKERERNQRALVELLRTEKLDTIPVERWKAHVAEIRKLLGGSAAAV